MNAPNRKSFTENVNISLVGEVGSRCPRCSQALIYKKVKSLGKNYEIAHIYPVNPRPHEEVLLRGEERLGDDVNDLENLIALCLKCHNEFDNPRTVEDYRDMVVLKKSIIERLQQQKLVEEHHLEEELSSIIEGLESWSGDGVEQLSLDPKELDEKLDETMRVLTRRRVFDNVTDYYSFIKIRLKYVEEVSPNASERVSIQVKLFYLQQAKRSSDQQVIYGNVVEWFLRRTNGSREACEILVSFFIQNCEIFK